jgi:AraC family transcriptional regulator, regulatory protein of adaptative response / methylated-DNA-[protein]-cysteine methyltransferase
LVNQNQLFMKEANINYQRIEEAIHFLETNFQKQPELDEVAEKIHLSPFHFQRIFTEWAGISPKRFLQFLTVDFLKTKIAQTRNLNEAAEVAGLSAQSRVYDLFVNLEAVTPQEYKLNGDGIQIQYGFHQTIFGNALIGVTSRGICWLSFYSPENELMELETMKSHWFNSCMVEDNMETGKYIHRVFGTADELDTLPQSGKLSLLVKGTNFQVKVWEALLRVPEGGVTTYQEVAMQINKPRALQAVGSAVGANRIAYLIPCHRVIRKDGVLGEYRWSATRKKSIIGWEMAKAS